MLLPWKLAVVIGVIALILWVDGSESMGPSEVIQGATEVIGVIRLGVSLVSYIHKVFSDICETSDCENIVTSASENNNVDKQILSEYRHISAGMDRLEQSMESLERVVYELKTNLPQMVRYELRLDRLEQIINSIGGMYRMFEFYQENRDSMEKITLEDFATSVTSHADGSVMSNLNELNRLVVPGNDGPTFSEGVLNILARSIKNQPRMCGMKQSPHQIMYNLYNTIALTEIKGYAMVQFSYMMLKIYNKGNFSVESDVARQKFEKQATEKLQNVKAVLPELSRSYWRCDPRVHEEGKTYLQITKLLQGYIENEVDMNEKGTCKKSCSAYTYAESRGCFKDLFCAKQPRCQGRIFDCQFFNADAWVCMSPGQDRRYDWVEYEDGTQLGNKGQCINKIKVDSWWRWVFWHCSYCMCKCDEVGYDSDRYWSLKPAVADLSNNKVVTGARFVKKDRVIHIQIEEAVALPEGVVDEKTRSWVEPADISQTNFTNNRDVFTMSYEQRALDTDDLTAPTGHVVTGIKLRNIGGHINLELQVTPIRFSTGILVTDRSAWIANDNTPATSRPRELVPIILPDVPTKYKGQSEIDSEHDKYIQFDATSVYKDVSQTTIPFLDAQPVSPSSATWLSGAGMYHKGRVGYGGFVGLSVETFDFSRHLLTGNPENGQAQLRYDFVKAEDH